MQLVIRDPGIPGCDEARRMPETLTVPTLGVAPHEASLEEAALVPPDEAVAHDAANAASIDALPEMPPGLRREPRACSAEDPIMALVYRALDASFDALQRELPRVWHEDTVSGVHRMRMATRRTRAVLRTFRDILPRQPTRALADESAWLAGELGRVRDLDVHIALIERSRGKLSSQSSADLEPYIADMRKQRVASHVGVLQSLAGERFAKLSRDFIAYLDQGPSAGALRRSRGLSAREGAERFALRALRRTRKAGRDLELQVPPEQLHKLRLRCKRLRYLLEAFEPIYGERLQDTIKALKRVQDALGDERDISSAIEKLRAYARATRDNQETAPATSDDRARCGTACLELVHVQERELQRARQRFERAWRHFGERVCKKKLRRGLRRPRPVIPVAAA